MDMDDHPTGAAPKPNTRFLRNIIRETDTHNAALLAKERREARERERQRSRRGSPDRRQHGRLSPYGDAERSRKRRRSLEDYSKDHRHGRQGAGNEDMDRGSDRPRCRRDHSSSRSPKRRTRDRDCRHRQGSRSGSSTGRPAAAASHRRPRRRGDDREVSRLDRGDGCDGPNLFTRGSATSAPAEPENDSDSDPLEAIVGPPPPPAEDASVKVRRRGRGAMAANRAAMDEHFDASYDPKIDVQPDPETEDDWGQALEALRDRQRWKQQGADRLKAAGFTDEEVRKWAKGDEKDESDVRWTKNGEDREWDRGKIVDEDA